MRSRATLTVAPRRAALPIDWSRSRHAVATKNTGQIGQQTRRVHRSLFSQPWKHYTYLYLPRMKKWPRAATCGTIISLCRYRRWLRQARSGRGFIGAAERLGRRLAVDEGGNGWRAKNGSSQLRNRRNRGCSWSGSSRPKRRLNGRERRECDPSRHGVLYQHRAEANP